MTASSLQLLEVRYPHIEFHDDSPYVSGSRVPVRRIWDWYQRGVPVATLIKRYPTLGPAKVLTAIAFAYDNLKLIEWDMTSSETPRGDPRQQDMKF